MAAIRSSLRSQHSYSTPQQIRHVTFDLPAHPHSHRSRIEWGFHELIPARPGIGHIDEKTLSLASTLACLNGDAGIPRSLLMRAGRPLRRWNLDGEPEDVSPTDMGLLPELVEVLSSTERTQYAINQLLFHGLLNLGIYPGGDATQALRMDAGTRASYKQGMLDPHRWMLQALLLVCHVFPADPHLDVIFHNIGVACTVQLQHVVTQYYDHLQAMQLISTKVKRSVSRALTVSTYFSSRALGLESILRAEQIAATLSEPDKCLNMMILTRKCSLFRSEGLPLPDMHDQPSFSPDNKRLNAVCGQLSLARSSMSLQDEDVNTAFSLLQDIQPVDRSDISTLEELILQKKGILWGQIRRCQGRFEEARQILEAIYEARHFPRGVVSVGESSCDLVSNLAATLCELGDAGKAEILLSTKLEDILENEFNPLVPRNDDILKLKLALAEAALQQGEYWRAQDLYWDLNRYICITPSQPESIRTTCRSYIGLARVHHAQENWTSALKHLGRALRIYEKYPSAQDYGLVVVYASISHVKERLGDAQGAASSADEARKLFELTGRQYWYTGLGTGWFDEVMPGIGGYYHDAQ